MKAFKKTSKKDKMNTLVSKRYSKILIYTQIQNQLKMFQFQINFRLTRKINSKEVNLILSSSRRMNSFKSPKKKKKQSMQQKIF